MPLNELIENRNTGKEMYELSALLKNNYNLSGTFASNEEWHYFSYIAYYLKSKYFGIPLKNLSSNDLSNDLIKNSTDYYLV